MGTVQCVSVFDYNRPAHSPVTAIALTSQLTAHSTKDIAISSQLTTHTSRNLQLTVHWSWTLTLALDDIDDVSMAQVDLIFENVFSRSYRLDIIKKNISTA